MKAYTKCLLLLVSVLATLTSCSKKDLIEVDTIFYNGTVYTCDSTFSVVSAVAIKDGRFIGIGNDDEILDQYISPRTVDLKKKPVYPGFIDAHSHFYGYGKDLQELDLKSATSFEDMINMTAAYGEKTNPSFIIGRGWNEEDWVVKGTISKVKLDILFPNTPVFLQRVDGHAALCNQTALDLAGITETTEFVGGRVEKMGPFLTGLLIDKAAEKVMERFPEPSLQQQIMSLIDAQNACYRAGLTLVTDAGLKESIILLIDSLQRTGALTMPVYAMSNPDTNAITRLLKNDNIRNNDRLQFSSIKLYADGSLGSRGALLKTSYCDDSTQIGLLQESIDYYRALIDYCYRNNLQVNTHCIGDSANGLLLGLYAEKLKSKNNLRWRIEHAQVVDLKDFDFFKQYDIIPSVQPTHATSDASMAKKRLCNHDNMKGAYAYKSLLNTTGNLALGTDFPVEEIDPIATFFSAVKRRTKSGDVFKPEEALSPKEALMGMTYWAARASFLEDRLGSVEIGKEANLTILSEDIMTAYEQGRIKNIMTVLRGDAVFSDNTLRFSQSPNQ